jgi:putative Mn2+ efflux pump MntP
MGVFDWAERKSNALTIWDIGLLKIYCVLFGIVVGAYLSLFVREHVWWFVALVLILGGGLGYRWFTAETR